MRGKIIVVVATLLFSLSACKPTEKLGAASEPAKTQSASPNLIEVTPEDLVPTEEPIEIIEDEFEGDPLLIEIGNMDIDNETAGFLGYDLGESIKKIQPLIITALYTGIGSGEPIYKDGELNHEKSWSFVYNLISDWGYHDERAVMTDTTLDVPAQVVSDYFASSFNVNIGKIPPIEGDAKELVTFDSASNTYKLLMADGEGEYDYEINSIQLVGVSESKVDMSLLKSVGINEGDKCLKIFASLKLSNDESAEPEFYFIYMFPKTDSIYLYSLLNVEKFNTAINENNSSMSSYSNARYNYAIKYPSYFKGLGESDNGDGQVFQADDGTEFRVWGAHLLENENVKELIKKKKPTEGKIILESTYDDNVFFFSEKSIDSEPVEVVDFYHKVSDRETDDIIAFEFIGTPGICENYKEMINTLATDISGKPIPEKNWSQIEDKLNQEQ